MQKSQTVCVTLVVMVLIATCLNYYGVIRYSLLPSFESPSKFNEYESSTEKKPGSVSFKKFSNAVYKHANKVNNSQTDSVEFFYSSDDVYTAAKQVHDSTYKITKQSEACKKEVPQVIVLGVWKCGTREITDFISMHPHIVIKAFPHEANYFFRAQPDRDYTYYKSIMPCSYSDQFTWVKNPFYFGKPGIANKIHKFNSNLKLIVLVRDPVDRLLSSVSFQLNNLRDLKRNFNGNATAYFYSEVFNKATGEINEESKHVAFSRYADGYREYLKFFSRDQILVIDSTQFKNDPQSTLEEVETFLGLNHFIKKEHFVYNNDKKFYCIRTHTKGTRNMTAICYGSERGRTAIKLQVPNRELDVLRKYFQPYNEEFFKLLGRRMDWKEQTKV